MTTHILSKDAMRKGESTADAFRRLAREKPEPASPCSACHWCGQDHRGPIEYWPERERILHTRACWDERIKLNGGSLCQMCEPYNEPGWMWNANQRIRCFDCNPTTCKAS